MYTYFCRFVYYKIILFHQKCVTIFFHKYLIEYLFSIYTLTLKKQQLDLHVMYLWKDLFEADIFLVLRLEKLLFFTIYTSIFSWLSALFLQPNSTQLFSQNVCTFKYLEFFLAVLPKMVKIQKLNFSLLYYLSVRDKIMFVSLLNY